MTQSQNDRLIGGYMTTNRNWIRTAIAHREPDAVPYNFSFSPPALEALKNHYGTDDVQDTLDFPIRMTGCKGIKPLYASPGTYGETIADEFGVVWTTSDIDRGSPIGPPLAHADLAGYPFPSPRSEYRFEGLDAWCRNQHEHFTVLWVGDLWERATFIRGMENLLLDVALDPDFVEKLLRRLTEYILETMEVLFDRFEFDAIALSDDYGTQRAMIMSPALWRRLLRPCLADIFGMAKRHARYTFLHSCGNIVPIIGDLIELGLDILHPIQPEAMDVYQLKRDFGRDLTFCGGLRTQDLLPRGTPDQVRDDVRRLKDIMGAGGGYILEPGITLQADVPLANMVAMIEEARRGS
jgi:uroporphyrinogen decarboxylase